MQRDSLKLGNTFQDTYLRNVITPDSREVFLRYFNINHQRTGGCYQNACIPTYVLY